MPAPRRGHAPCQGEGPIRPIATILASLAFTGAATAAPRHWHAPTWWLNAALCIHHYEGAWNANTGNGYFGGLQFLASTYRSVGGRRDGRADLDSPREQLYRAWLVWRRDGGSFREWGTAGRCGLR